jgi:hypothetical protein
VSASRRRPRESIQIPGTSAVEEFDLQGRLGAFSISDIFQMFSYTEKTGTLAMIQGWNTRTISFERGRISYVAAGSRLPTIPDLLVRNSIVDRATLQHMAQDVDNDDDLISLLLKEKVVTPDDMQHCQDQLLEISIYTLFLWRNCYFTFKAGELVKEGGVPVNLDSTHLIIEGTRRVDEWIEVSPVVPSVFMVFRHQARQPNERIPAELADIFRLIDGHNDVVSIARAAGVTQFEAARTLYELTRAGFIESIPPNRVKVIELFNQAVESIYLKLVLFDFSRAALQFENQLNRFAIENRLKVRMSAGKILISDTNTPISTTELVDLYKLFIGIQNNKFSKEFEPVVSQGLMEGLYRHTDPEMQALMRMYEFVEIEGLVLLEQMGSGFGRRSNR